jgi:proline iminopeptidase
MAMAIDYGPYFDPEEAGRCPAPGGAVWYRIDGKAKAARGRTALLCIHGGPGLSHHYLLSLVALADERPVVFYDQLDGGSADRPGDPANWTVERFVDEIDAVRRHLNLAQVHVLGSSWGGTIAAEYAIRRPPGLRSLILASPLLNTPRWVADCTAHRRALPADLQAVLDEHEAAGTVESEAYQDAVMVFYKRHLCRMDPWPWEVERSFALFNYDLYHAMWGPAEFTATGTLKDYDATARLGRIAAPTLVTAGEHDECTPAAAHELAALIPGAQVAIADGCSHMAHLEKPAEYLAVVRGFLAEVESGSKT